MIAACVNFNVVQLIVTIPDTPTYKQYAAQYELVIDITNTIPQPAVGWVFNGSTLVGVPASMKITPLSFRNRFTIAELVGIYSYAQNVAGNGANAYAVQVYIDNLQCALYVDLSDPQTSNDLSTMVALGLLTSPRQTTILTTPPLPSELYTGL
jgi:hypothetical protein